MPFVPDEQPAASGHFVPDQPAAPESNIGRTIGLGARAAVEGVATLPLMVGDAVNWGRRQAGEDVGSASGGLEFALDQAGLPKPETKGERIGGDVVRGAAGAVTGPLGGAGRLAMAAAGAMGGGASGVVREAGGGTAAQIAAGLAGGMTAGGPSMLRNSMRGEGIKDTAKDAISEGYTVPPALAGNKPGYMADKLQTLASPPKTAAQAIIRNQEQSNTLGQAALGVPAGTALTEDAFDAVRKQAGNAYQAVKDVPLVIKTDVPFRRAINQIDGKSSQLAREFPEVVSPEVTAMKMDLFNHAPMSTEAMIGKVGQLRADAVTNFKALGDPSKHALGLAQRNAADAMEDLVERNLNSANLGDLVKDYRDARRTIAKSYDLQSVTNTVSGNVSAIGLARLQKNGRPLTDELKKIADFGAVYPQVARRVEDLSLGSKQSLGDMDFAGAAASALGGHYGLAGAIIGRPAARAAILSRRMQNAMGKAKEPIAPLAGAGAYGLEKDQAQ